MKVLLINGSCHEKGCTYTALSEVAGALDEQKIEVEVFQLGGKPIRDCIGCGNVPGWRMPVFLMTTLSMSLSKKPRKQTDLFLERLYTMPIPAGAFFRRLTERFMRQRAHSLISLRQQLLRQDALEPPLLLMFLNKYFTIAEMPVVSSSYWNMVHGNTPDEVKQDKEGLQSMRNLGRNMAWLLQCISAGSEQGINAPQNEYNHRTNFIR